MAPFPKYERGVGLLETVIAAVILLFVALAAATIFYQGAVSTVNTKQVLEANHMAQKKIEELKALGRGNIDTIMTVAGITGPGVPYADPESTTIGNDLPATMTTTIEYIDDPADGDPGDTDYARIEVKVDWLENNQSRERALQTDIFQ
ncbi:MAG: hypothetical protein AB1797_03555 [bacterium]